MDDLIKEMRQALQDVEKARVRFADVAKKLYESRGWKKGEFRKLLKKEFDIEPSPAYKASEAKEKFLNLNKKLQKGG